MTAEQILGIIATERDACGMRPRHYPLNMTLARLLKVADEHELEIVIQPKPTNYTPKLSWWYGFGQQKV